MKKKNPLISIVLPAHNEEAHIEVCLNSLLNQSYKPIEIFIVDDGSKDKTAEIVRKFAPKVTLLQQPQSGPGIAWNTGFKHTKGEILMFWASDHIYGKDYIKDLATPIIKGEALRTVQSREDIANADKIWARGWGEREPRDINETENTTAALTSRQVFLKAGGFDPKRGYADDQSIYDKTKIKTKIVHTTISHFNPESLKESFAQAAWIGASFKRPYLTLLSLPLFPFYVVGKSVRHFIKDPYIPFIVFLPIFYTVKYFGHYFGILRKIVLKKNTRI
ncbi:MAG: glycosyltransferase family 2 protein [Candidatus Nanoarchaeia archaeon]|nr:glycosyltransferase family 2 protein [Candidatus Nanoarchaeia archaeon]MDD5587598.1 glycosyltransferase family 2 protein [Candidatus Nanoarchaeia archaeon]